MLALLYLVAWRFRFEGASEESFAPGFFQDPLVSGDFQPQLEDVLAETPVLLVLVTPRPSGPPGDWREGLSSMETVRPRPGWLSAP